jgi:glycosyltransferase involved in cell wall biosynthesis
MPVAIHYSSVKTDAAGEVFGIQVAIQDLLKAYFRYGRTQKFSFLIGDSAARQEITDLADAARLDPARLVLLDQRHTHENLPLFDTVFRADLHSGNLLWQRQGLTPGFAFCGLAHAVSGQEGGKLLEQYCLAPSEAGDAILCPSHAIADAIRAYWDIYADYLQRRFGAHFRCPVELPVIPLGIDVDKFAARIRPDRRTALRAMLGLSEGEVVLLWVGRLSHAIKAHPLAMFQAAERAAELTNMPIHLVMQGYFVPREAEGQFRKLAQAVCRKARVTFVANDDPRFPDGLWAAGDIFLSLIDNMQESFGLTPIEAMAAGLPRVVSDWDGYRDSVTQGEDGFLIRTRQPPPGSGKELADLVLRGKEIYGGFLGKTALSVAVDQEMAAQAIALLVADKGKRMAMAEKARARAKAIYDWRSVIPAYEALWQELAARRRKDTSATLDWPLLPDPFAMYAGYPTSPLTENDKLAVALPEETIKLLLRHDINLMALDMMIAPDDAMQLINFVAAQGSVSIGKIFAEAESADAAENAALWRTLGWLIKLGILRVL